jgi:DNA-3-methyladenine glycosylase II
MHYVEHLGRDKKLKKLIDEHGTFQLEKKNNLFLYLCYSIMIQQLSTKDASEIKQRFLNLYDGAYQTPR